MSLKYHKDKICRLLPDKNSSYKHRFGGESNIKISCPANWGYALPYPLHLLIELDLDDPLCCFESDNLHKLPLLYPFRYGQGSSKIGYQVHSDNEIKIIHFEGIDEPDANKAGEGWYSGSGDYPDFYHEYSLALNPLRQEDYKLLLLADYETFPSLDEKQIREVFGENESLLLAEALREKSWDELTCLIAEKKGLYKGIRIGGKHIPMQGLYTKCMNPSCSYYLKMDKVDIFAIIGGNPFNTYLWEEGGGDDVQILYELCFECGSIYARNECG